MPAYDDIWLRDMLADMREEVRRHADRDEEAHKELREAIAELRHDLSAISLIGRIVRGVVAFAASAGAVGWMIKHFIGLDK